MKTVYRLSPFIVIGTLVNLCNFVILTDNNMLLNTEPVTILIDYETTITCRMSEKPDKFRWKFYPSDEPYNPKADINLSNASYELLPSSMYTSDKSESTLRIEIKDTRPAGDYQCLADYGALVRASIPRRVTIATLGVFPPQKSIDITVVPHNTISWQCTPPSGNPEPYIDYKKDDLYVRSPFDDLTIKSLILPNVTLEDSGVYSCVASNMVEKTNKSDAVLRLNVVRNMEYRIPYFIISPKKSYTVIRGTTAFLECSAVGNPVPKVIWYKKNSQLPSRRAEMVSGGLKITNISETDEGIYVCNFTNSYGMISHHINVVYNEEPSVDCLLNNTELKQGEHRDIECVIRGKPEPQLSFFLNGFSVYNDSAIKTIRNKIYFSPVEKRHAGNLQVFARNSVKTVKADIDIKVIPISMSIELNEELSNTHSYTHQKTHRPKRPLKHNNKPPKMIPPSKPNITRLNDESVVVRWNVPENNGLPIQFLKVQYREVGSATSDEHHKPAKSSRWKTTEKDIPPNIKAYDVTNLKPGHYYKFRIAAVYSNNDYNMSPISKRFLLERLDFDERNPLPTPRIIRTETVNSTSVKIYWECNIPSNITIDGFYISYMSASTAGDYMKATAEGNTTRSYTITHLTPETFYDIKIQSFNSTLASEFSSIMTAKTGVSSVRLIPPVMTVTTTTTSPINQETTSNVSSLYIIIAGGIFGIVLLVCAVILLFVCRKWKQKKMADNGDKPAVEDHHIQADSNDYVMNSKSISRANGHVMPGNRITITPNPLADADNKSQAMIEMRNFTGQNNNVRPENSAASASNSGSDAQDANHSKHRKKEKSSKKKSNVEVSAPEVSNENYV